MKTLYLFVTSDRPDQYLNSVAHCVLNEGVRAVEYISVRYPDQNNQQPGGLAGKIAHRVTVLLNEIVNDGSYKNFQEPDPLSSRHDLRTIYPDRLNGIRELYRPCLSLQPKAIDLPSTQLREKIRSVAQSTDSIVDITSAKKSLLGDILAASVVEGLDRLYTFELTSPPDFDRPWSMLLHDLLPAGKGYTYVNLVETDVFKECSRSILVRPPYLKGISLAAIVLLVATAVLVFFYGDNWVAKWSSIFSLITGLLSLGYPLFSVHRR
jgi:hypothetical protein